MRAVRLAVLGLGPVMAALGLIAAHNYATTGSVRQMAYQLHEARYGVAPLNIFQAVREPEMKQWSVDVPPAFFDFHYGWSLQSYHKRAHLGGWLAGVAERVHLVATLWGGAFCLVALGLLARGGQAYWPLAAAVAVALFVGTFIPWYFSHYFAPSLVWLVIVTAAGWRALMGRFAGDRRHLRLCTLALLTAQGVFLVVELRAANARPETWADARQRLNAELERTGHQHLVLVRYAPGHNVHREWVFNEADLEQTAVLWARSWRPDLDQQLVRHYRSQRRIWLLEVDQRDQPRLSPFPATDNAAGAGESLTTTLEPTAGRGG